MSQDGTTYRFAGDEERAASVRNWCWAAAALSLAAGVCLTVWLGQLAFKPDEAPLPSRVEREPVVRKNIDPAVTVVPGPLVQAKPALPPVAARVKPSGEQSTVKQRIPADAQVAAIKTEPPPSRTNLWRSTAASSLEELEAQLRKAPEVDLDSDYLKRTKQQIAQKAKEIGEANKDKEDAFVRSLIKDRQDLAGLPFLLGKDCSLSAQQSRVLARRSLEIRDAMAQAARAYARSGGRASPGGDLVASLFWSRVGARSDWLKPDIVPAMQQILLAESADFRLNVISHFKEIKDAKATEAILGRAIFDLDLEVRRIALLLLHNRPKAEYRATLKKALRYPWPPAVRHAAEAIVSLEVKEMIPDLVALLDEPHPGAPFTFKAGDGMQKNVVRELVRINHHRNCMLCHAPVHVGKGGRFDRGIVPVGPAPSPQEPLPPMSSAEYYEDLRPGATLVRADITYLRQDFSLVQLVDNPGKWSDLQRFDFLVRTRELTPNEVGQHLPARASAAYKETIVEALIALTGKNAPPTAQAWREALARPEPSVEAKVKAMR